uniref:Uncharacterized protein n=1 Tax=Arundo donax TaxID=35708 RepID=A0A0A9DND7_ARUDO
MSPTTSPITFSADSVLSSRLSLSPVYVVTGVQPRGATPCFLVSPSRMVASSASLTMPSSACPWSQTPQMCAVVAPWEAAGSSLCVTAALSGAIVPAMSPLDVAAIAPHVAVSFSTCSPRSPCHFQRSLLCTTRSRHPSSLTRSLQPKPLMTPAVSLP